MQMIAANLIRIVCKMVHVRSRVWRSILGSDLSALSCCVAYGYYYSVNKNILLGDHKSMFP